MKLIVNADDFGLTSGVNQGILDCFLAKSVSSATLMVNTAATEEAVEMARAHPELGVGLHFNLTLGKPLSQQEDVSPLIGRDGNFLPRSQAERNLLFCRFRPEQIDCEFQAQVNRYRELGLPMTHIDSHQHIHLFPQVFDVVAKYCVRHDIPLRVPWVWRGNGRFLNWKKRVRSRLLDLLVLRNWRKWGDKLRTNRGFGSVFDLTTNSADISPRDYMRLIGPKQKSPFELMVHPAWVDKELKALTRITTFSEAETNILTGLSLGRIAAEQGWSLVSYRVAFDCEGQVP